MKLRELEIPPEGRSYHEFFQKITKNSDGDLLAVRHDLVCLKIPAQLKNEFKEKFLDKTNFSAKISSDRVEFSTHVYPCKENVNLTPD